MKSQTVFHEIFELTIKKLSSHYKSGTPIPKSEDFEKIVEQSIGFAIKKWNSERPAKGQKEIEVVLLGGKKFPDIVLHNKSDGEKIGLEVKLHSKGKTWTTKGNSAIASTQVPDLQAIYLLFGHFGLPIPEFRIKPIEQCICKLEVTHKPRYQINMDYKAGDFCEKEIGIPYNQLRTLKKEYREILIFSCVAKENYMEIHRKDKKEMHRLIANSFVLFPELFSSTPSKRYSRITEWFFAQNILASNIRDYFSAKGKVSIKDIGNERLPRIYSTLYKRQKQFHTAIEKTPAIILKHYWDDDYHGAIPPGAADRIKLWLNLVCEQYGGSEKKITGTTYKFRETLEKILNL